MNIPAIIPAKAFTGVEDLKKPESLKPVPVNPVNFVKEKASFQKVLSEVSKTQPGRDMPEHKNDKTLKVAVQELESFFIYFLLKEMRKSVLDSGLYGESRSMDIYRDMMDEELGRVMAKSGGIGLSEMLLQQLSKNNVEVKK